MTDFLSEFPIDPARLSRAHFLEELIEEAVRFRLLSERDTENLQLQWLHLLQRRVKKYTRGESSSVRVETAEKLAGGILYTVGFELKSAAGPREILRLLKETPLSALYGEGQKKLFRKVKDAGEKGKAARATALNVGNIAYHDTLERGIPSFFDGYDAEFFPQDTGASIDYPLYSATMEWTGVEYIDDYLDRLLLENRFCGLFESGAVRTLLEETGDTAAEDLINIFGLAMKNAAASVMLGGSARSLDLRAEDAGRLTARLEACAPAQIRADTERAVSRMTEELGIAEAPLRRYVLAASEGLAAEWTAIAQRRCRAAPVTVADEGRASPLTFIDQPAMDDGAFRELTEEIRSCRRTDDKLALVKSGVRSLEDLRGVLDADCFFGEEYGALYRSLGTWELALVASELLQETGEVSSAVWEEEWQRQFLRYLGGIGDARRAALLSLAERIRRGI